MLDKCVCLNRILLLVAERPAMNSHTYSGREQAQQGGMDGKTQRVECGGE